MSYIGHRKGAEHGPISAKTRGHEHTGDRVVSDYSITTARPADVGSLAAIELAAAKLLIGHAPESVLNEATDESTFRDAQAAGELWVALADDIPVGFALVKMLAPELPHLEEIDVHPTHGKRGLGTALVHAVCDWATRSGYREVTLTTLRDVPWNMPFYSRLGFEEIRTSDLRPELVAVVREETARGLDPEARVVMRYRCAPVGRSPHS